MILSIESSCDDSSIAITQIATKELLYHKKISQDDAHALHGGVVPELAARLHTEALPRILAETKEFFPHLKAVAVTNEPGLTVSLIEGVVMAKTLCATLNIPLIPVNHLVGHIYSLFIEKEALFPLSVLLVSGGHTLLLEVDENQTMSLIGKTMDDSFGESFDKVAKMMNLGYPGGPIVERFAQKGDCKAIKMTTPLLQHKEIAFSFSGLKNAVRLATLTDLNDQKRYDICASFQHVAIDHVLRQVKKYFAQNVPQRFAIVGGASANISLRDSIEKICNTYKTELLVAPLSFCSDNAAMIGRAGIDLFAQGKVEKIENVEIKSRSSFN